MAYGQALGSVPIEYRPPTLMVEARVNRHRPLWFAFDTGASTSLIDAKVAERLGLKPAQRPGREIGRASCRERV